MKMQGTERQVAWATDIHEGYAKVAEILRDAVGILADLTQEKVALQSNPLAKKGNESGMGKRYTKNLGPGHEAAISMAAPWYPGERKPFDHEKKWMHDRASELAAQDNSHADRQAEKEFIEAAMISLEAALVGEKDARYWIDRRAK